MHPLLLRFLQGLSIKALARYSVAQHLLLKARGFAPPPHDGVALLAALPFSETRRFRGHERGPGNFGVRPFTQRALRLGVVAMVDISVSLATPPLRCSCGVVVIMLPTTVRTWTPAIAIISESRGHSDSHEHHHSATTAATISSTIMRLIVSHLLSLQPAGGARHKPVTTLLRLATRMARESRISRAIGGALGILANQVVEFGNEAGVSTRTGALVHNIRLCVSWV